MVNNDGLVIGRYGGTSDGKRPVGEFGRIIGSNIGTDLCDMIGSRVD